MSRIALALARHENLLESRRRRASTKLREHFFCGLGHDGAVAIAGCVDRQGQPVALRRGRTKQSIADHLGHHRQAIPHGTALGQDCATIEIGLGVAARGSIGVDDCAFRHQSACSSGGMQPAAGDHRGREIDDDGATRATRDRHAVRVRRQDRLTPAIGRSLAPALASAATDNDDEHAAHGCGFGEGTNAAGMPDIADRQNGHAAVAGHVTELIHGKKHRRDADAAAAINEGRSRLAMRQDRARLW